MSQINDGRHAFDFFHGKWRTSNRKLADVTDPTCTEWVEFESEAQCMPILGGLGNVDTLSSASFEGATLRMFVPETQTWRIWWMSTRYPGVLDPPVEGRFDGNRGIFEGPDEFHGKPIIVRYEWDNLGDGKAQWAQRFSWDDGKTWDELNWIATHTRI
ncbi:hypothetical protein [Catelliglobosispora koreensis]|uniref:hypothetical protein n=1 Tax=Catelliglobosispora koreensis TaxID=129052 RepID=UPI0003656AF1|nr:hypothetical protein [Catelliglobosispora koreensis]